MFFANTFIASSAKLKLVKRLKPFRPFSRLLSKVKSHCSSHSFSFSIPSPESPTRLSSRISTPPSPATMLHDNPVVSDVYATAISVGVAFSLLRLWQETAKRGIFDRVWLLPSYFNLEFAINRILRHLVDYIYFIMFPFSSWLFHVGHFAENALSSMHHGYNLVEDGPRWFLGFIAHSPNRLCFTFRYIYEGESKGHVGLRSSVLWMNK